MGILSAFRFAFQNLFFSPVLYGVIASLAVFSATWDKGDRIKDLVTDQFRSQDDTFDFIVVGGGSAGAVVAHRLSEFYRVLLLEAGGEKHPFQAIPALSLFLTNYPATDWMHKSTIQSASCLSCQDKRYRFSQGKNLGGSGNLNYLIHLRGSPKDYDNWARITDDPRWSYQQLLPFFCKSEHFVGATTDESAHGAGGPLQIEMPDEIGLVNEWNWAGQELGYRHLDLNGHYDEGFDAIYYPIKKGVRQATYLSYIQTARDRPSLVIRKFAHVNKVLMKDGTNTAYGVQYDRHGHAKYAFANKEVILSAGTLQTPKILMLSGIGPRINLEHFNIPVRVDLPVGQNFHDHISTLVGPFFINSDKTFSFDDDVTQKSFYQFYASGTGALTTSGFQATALMTSSLAQARGQVGWPDIQLTLFGISPHRLFASDMAHAFGLREDILNRYYLGARGKNGFFIHVSVSRPESRGELCLHSADPNKPLSIDPQFYSDPEGKDMRVLLQGISRALIIAENTTVFQNCGARFYPKALPGCEGHAFRSESYWECFARHFSITLDDHVGTAAMGYKGSPFAVVDPELKVMGVSSLRVIDASVMPTIVGANTQAATIMIGERGAAFVLEKWGSDHPYGHSENPTDAVLIEQNGGGAGLLLPPTGFDDINFDHRNPLHPPLLRGAKVSNPDVIHIVQAQPAFGDRIKDHGSSSSVLPPELGSLFGETGASPSSDLSTQLHAPGHAEGQTPTLYNEVYSPVYSKNFVTTPATPFPPDTQQFFAESSSPSPETLEKGLVSKVRESKNIQQPVFSEFNSGGQEIRSEEVKPTSSFLTRGPNGGSLIMRRRKRPPNVTVHPRGHLGYEDVTRRPRPRYPSGTVSTPSTPSTSIVPLPRNIIKVRRRRPRLPESMRRKFKTSTTTEESLVPEASSITPIYATSTGGGGYPNRSGRRTTPRGETNGRKVSHSVSAVVNRLRNYIPKSKDAQESAGNTLRGKRGGTHPSDRALNFFKSYRDKQQLKTATRVGNSTEDLEEMIVFSDVDLSQSSGSGKEKDGKGRSNSSLKDGSNDLEGHPYMLMDMDPFPKIIARPSFYDGGQVQRSVSVGVVSSSSVIVSQSVSSSINPTISSSKVVKSTNKVLITNGYTKVRRKSR